MAEGVLCLVEQDRPLCMARDFVTHAIDSILGQLSFPSCLLRPFLFLYVSLSHFICLSLSYRPALQQGKNTNKIEERGRNKKGRQEDRRRRYKGWLEESGELINDSMSRCGRETDVINNRRRSGRRRRRQQTSSLKDKFSLFVSLSLSRNNLNATNFLTRFSNPSLLLFSHSSR